MSEQFEIVPDEPEVDAADLESANEEAVLEAEASQEETEESATPEDDQGEDQDEKLSRADKRKAKIKSEIDALTREKYQARREAEESQRELNDMRQWMAQQQANQVPQAGDLPKLADFDYDEARYQQAIQQWHANSVQQARQQQEYSQHQQEQYASQVQEAQMLQAKVAEGTKKYADFAVKVNDPSLPPLRNINPAAFQAVIDSPQAVDVAYYLANNVADVYAFADMNPVQAIKRVAQLEAKLANTPGASGRLPPKPPTTVKGSADAAPKDPQKMSTDEWMKWRNRQTAKKR